MGGKTLAAGARDRWRLTADRAPRPSLPGVIAPWGSPTTSQCYQFQFLHRIFYLFINIHECYYVFWSWIYRFYGNMFKSFWFLLWLLLFGHFWLSNTDNLSIVCYKLECVCQNQWHVLWRCSFKLLMNKIVLWGP